MLRYTHHTPFSDQSTYLTGSLNFLLQAGDKVLLFSTDGASERMVMCGQVINIYISMDFVDIHNSFLNLDSWSLCNCWLRPGHKCQRCICCSETLLSQGASGQLRILPWLVGYSKYIVCYCVEKDDILEILNIQTTGPTLTPRWTPSTQWWLSTRGGTGALASTRDFLYHGFHFRPPMYREYTMCTLYNGWSEVKTLIQKIASTRECSNATTSLQATCSWLLGLCV